MGAGSNVLIAAALAAISLAGTVVLLVVTGTVPTELWVLTTTVVGAAVGTAIPPDGAGKPPTDGL